MGISRITREPEAEGTQKTGVALQPNLTLAWKTGFFPILVEGLFALCECKGRVLEKSHDERPEGFAMIAFDLFDGIFVASQFELFDAVIFCDLLEGGVAENGVGKPEHPAIWKGERVGLGDDIKRCVIVVTQSFESDDCRGGGPAQSRFTMNKDCDILDVSVF